MRAPFQAIFEARRSERARQALAQRPIVRILVAAAGLLLCAAAVEAAGILSPAPAAPAPPLMLPDLSGQVLDLETLRGKVVLVSFWASWCSPCIEEIPSLQRLAEAMRGKPFAIVGVNLAEGRLRVKGAIQRLDIRFPVVLDSDSAAFDRWGASLLPTTYVLDTEGVVRFVGRGPIEWDSDEVMSLLEPLMPPDVATAP